MNVILKLFLPLIIFNTLFGNSYNEALEIVSQILGIMLIALCFLILNFFARKEYSVILLVILIISKVISLLSGLSLFYDIAYSILFIFTGAYIFEKYMHIIRNQFLLYFVISGAIIFFQVTGWYPQLHLFNIYVLEYFENYGSIYGSEINFPDVFFKYGDRYSLFEQNQIYLSNIQNRPSGIFHSNAYLGPFMLFSHFFIIMWFKKRRNAVLFFIMTFFLFITGSKLVLFCSFICLVFNKNFLGVIYYKTLLIYLLSFFLYYIIFPTVLLSNFIVDAIYYSLGIRLIDLINSSGNFDFLFQDELVTIYANFDNEDQGFSGLSTLVVALILLGSFYFIYKKRVAFFFQAQFINSEFKFLFRCTLIWCTSVFFTTPLLGNHLISFILGLLILPLIAKPKGVIFLENEIHIK